MTDYSKALAGHPQASSLLRARVANSKHADDRIVAWVHAIAQSYSEHASQLENTLARKSVPQDQLGTLAEPWDAVAHVAISAAHAAAETARRLKAEIETPLSSASQVYVANATPDNPVSVEKADLERAGAIRDALVRLQTIFTDASQAVVASAETATSKLLAFDPADEAAAFEAQVVSGVAPREQPQSHRLAPPVNHRQAPRKPSHTSLSDSISHNSEKKRGIRAKMGSIFGRRKTHKYAGDHASSIPDSPVSSARSAPRSPSSTQPPDFGLRPRRFEEIHPTENESEELPAVRSPPTHKEAHRDDIPLSQLRGQRREHEVLQPQKRLPKEPQDASGDRPSGATFDNNRASQVPPGATTELSDRSAVPTAPASGFAPNGHSFEPLQPLPHQRSSPHAPPPRGGQPIRQSTLFHAPRESVVDPEYSNHFGDHQAIPENSELSGNMSQISLGAGNISRRQSLRRDLTGTQNPPMQPAPPNMPNLPITASVLESIVSTEDNVDITGEVVLQCNDKRPQTIRIVNGQHLASLVPHSEAMVAGNELSSYYLDPSRLPPTGALARYTGNFPALVAVSFEPQWLVVEPTSSNESCLLRLILKYKLDDDYPIDRILLKNFEVAVSVTGVDAKSAQSKPLATFSRHKQRVTWRFVSAPVEVSKTQPGRLTCQFVTAVPGYGSPCQLNARYEIDQAPTAISVQYMLDGQYHTAPTAAVSYMQNYTRSTRTVSKE